MDWIALVGAMWTVCIAAIWDDFGFDRTIPPRLAIIAVALALLTVIRLAHTLMAGTAKRPA